MARKRTRQSKNEAPANSASDAPGADASCAFEQSQTCEASHYSQARRPKGRREAIFDSRRAGSGRAYEAGTAASWSRQRRAAARDPADRRTRGPDGCAGVQALRHLHRHLLPVAQEGGSQGQNTARTRDGAAPVALDGMEGTIRAQVRSAIQAMLPQLIQEEIASALGTRSRR